MTHKEVNEMYERNLSAARSGEVLEKVKHKTTNIEGVIVSQLCLALDTNALEATWGVLVEFANYYQLDNGLTFNPEFVTPDRIEAI